MSTLRFYAIKETFDRKPIAIEENVRRSELFGKNVFKQRNNAIKIRNRLFMRISPI